MTRALTGLGPASSQCLCSLLLPSSICACYGSFCHFNTMLTLLQMTRACLANPRLRTTTRPARWSLHSQPQRLRATTHTRRGHRYCLFALRKVCLNRHRLPAQHASTTLLSGECYPVVAGCGCPPQQPGAIADEHSGIHQSRKPGRRPHHCVWHQYGHLASKPLPGKQLVLACCRVCHRGSRNQCTTPHTATATGLVQPAAVQREPKSDLCATPKERTCPLSLCAR